MDKKLRAAVIGLGPIGSNNHCMAYTTCPDAELVGACDINKERADAVAKRYGIPVWYSAQTMLDELKPDLVSVATGGFEYSSDHFEPTLQALRAGCDVLTEKPICNDLKKAQEMVDTAKAGFFRGKTEPKLGIRASATCEIEFQDYVAQPEELLGVEGEGFKIAMGVLDAGRIGIASQAVGLARAAYEAAVSYVKERKSFGAPIGSFQMIQAKIADMKCRLDAAELLTLRAAWAKAQTEKNGGRFSTEASIAKLTASEAAMFITHQALQIHGGMGYSKEMPLERYFRDAKITEIYEGTSEIQRLVIARNETGIR